MSIYWMIYLADVLPSLGTAIVLMSVAGIIGISIEWLIRQMVADLEKMPEIILPFRQRWFWGFFVAIMLAQLMPSHKAMYAMIAVDVVQQQAQTEIAGEALQALRVWIKKQIEEKDK